MIHIIKRGSKFGVVNLADNGAVLKPSETLSSKEKAWENIQSEANTCYQSSSVYVQDDTLPFPGIFMLYKNPVGKWEKMPTDFAIGPRYEPGRNKKAKSSKK